MTTTNPYHAAYAAALSHVTEITEQFEELRTRKSNLEQLVAALQSYLSPIDGVAEQTVAMTEAPAMESTEASTEAEADRPFSYLDVPNPLPENDGDPFQRRVKSTFRFKGLATQRSY